MRGLLIYLAVLNAAAFILYGMDKRRAKRGKWRIPERTLLLSAFLGGSLGAALGMVLFHHKTHKSKFRIGVPLALLLWILILCLIPSGVREWILRAFG